METNVYNALRAVKDIVTLDLLPAFDDLQSSDPVISSQINTLNNNVLTLIDLVSNIKPMHHGFFRFGTIPLSGNTFLLGDKVSGDLNRNSDGTLTLPDAGVYDFSFQIISSYSHQDGNIRVQCLDADTGELFGFAASGTPASTGYVENSFPCSFSVVVSSSPRRIRFYVYGRDYIVDFAYDKSYVKFHQVA